MTSDIPSTSRTPQPGKAHDDLDRTKDRVQEEAQSAKDEVRKAADNVRDTASDLSDKARAKAREKGEEGKEQVAGGLDDFAAAVRKASDELGSRDQSMASNLVREVAGGLEHASRTIHGKDVGELTQSVARFARERPATFLVGAALAGLALGRFARSSGEHDVHDYAGSNDVGGNRDAGRYARRSGASGGGAVPQGYRSSFSDQPRPTEGAYPASRDPVTGGSRSAIDTGPNAPDRSQRETRPVSASPVTSSARPAAQASTVKPVTGGTNDR